MRVSSSLVRVALAVIMAFAVSAPAVAQDRSAASPTDVTIASDSLQGTKVFDTDGKQLGSISRLLVGMDGKVTSVVIKHGGTAGLGGKEFAVPWDALKLQRGEKDRIIATMQRDVLEKAPSASPATDQTKK